MRLAEYTPPITTRSGNGSAAQRTPLAVGSPQKIPSNVYPGFIVLLLLCYDKEKDNGGGTFEHIQKRYIFFKKKNELLLNR